MKRIILFLAAFVCLAGYAQRQTVSGSTTKNTMVIKGGLVCDSVFRLPTTMPLISKRLSGSLYYQASDSAVYVWTGNQYIKVAGAGGTSYTFTNGLSESGGVVKADTGKLATRYNLYKVADSLGTIIAGLVLAAGDSSDYIRTTYTAFTSAGQIDSTKTYEIVDSVRNGEFTYLKYSFVTADGGVEIKTTANQFFRRKFSGDANARWWDIRQNPTYAAQNIVNLRKVRDYNLKTGVPILVSGDYEFGDSIWLPNQNVYRKCSFTFVGRIKWSGVNGAILATGTGSQGLYLSSRYATMTGRNSPATDSTGYAVYTQICVNMINLWNSYIEVNEIQYFKVGLEAAGNSAFPSLGNQFNEIHYGYLHHNQYQIRIMTYGTGGAFVNENLWIGAQLGQGVPNVTFGERGWWGIFIGRDASSNTVPNAINGHKFFFTNWEAAQIGFEAHSCKEISIFGGQFEPQGMRYHFKLDTAAATACDGLAIIGWSQFYEYMLPEWANGLNTRVVATNIQTRKPDGTGCCVLGGTDAYRSSITGKLVITNINNTGFSDETLNTMNDRYFLMTTNYKTQIGGWRISNKWRYGMVKPNYMNVGNSTGSADDTMQAPNNVGYIRLNTNENKVIKIDVDDLSGSSFEPFELEYTSGSFTVQFINSATNAVLMTTGQFSGAGVYTCTYRSGSYFIEKHGSGGGGGTQWISGSGTGSPIYYPNTVNIGGNPSQSYAWTTYGASATNKAIWEFSGSSAWSLTPRAHSIDYNGSDLRLTDGSGVPAVLLKANSVATITAMTWNGVKIGLNYIGTPGVVAGDQIVANGAGAATTQKPRYSLVYSSGAEVIVTAASSGSAVSSIGGAKSLGALVIGDIVECEGSGLVISAFGAPTSPSIDLVFGTARIHVGTVPSMPANSSRYFSYRFRATVIANGTNVNFMYEYEFYVENLGIAKGASSAGLGNQAAASVDVLANFNNSGNQFRFYVQSVELKRKP